MTLGIIFTSVLIGPPFGPAANRIKVNSLLLPFSGLCRVETFTCSPDGHFHNCMVHTSLAHMQEIDHSDRREDQVHLAESTLNGLLSYNR